jgi:WD40 repeat protein
MLAIPEEALVYLSLSLNFTKNKDKCNVGGKSPNMNKIEVNRVHNLTGHRDCVYSIQCGKSDADIYSAGGDGMIVQWNLESPETGDLIAKLPNSVYATLYLKSKDILVAAQNFEGLHFIDSIQRKEFASLKISKHYIFDLASYGNKIFCASGDGNITVMDVDGMQIIKHIDYSKKSARSIAINENRGEFAVGYSDNFIRVFDLGDYTLKHEWLAHDNSVFTLKYNLDGQSLLSGSRDAKLKVWSSNEKYRNVNEIVAHMYTINHIAFSPDGKHFVTCSMDKSIKVWDSQEFKLLKVIDKTRFAGHGTSVNKLAWTSFNNQLVSASDDKTLSVWDIIF